MLTNTLSVAAGEWLFKGIKVSQVFSLIYKKKTLTEAHTGNFLELDDLYHLGKLGLLYQENLINPVAG